MGRIWNVLSDYLGRRREYDRRLSLGDLRPWTSTPSGARAREQAERQIHELITFGRDNLLAADLGDSQMWSLDAWRDQAEQWTNRVSDALNQLGATERAKGRFREVGEFRQRGFRGINAEHVCLRECLEERLTRLGKIIGAEVAPFALDEGIIVTASGGLHAGVAVTNQHYPMTLVVRVHCYTRVLGGFDDFEFGPTPVDRGGCVNLPLAVLANGQVWAGKGLDRLQEPPVPSRSLRLGISLQLRSVADGESHELCRHGVLIQQTDATLLASVHSID